MLKLNDNDKSIQRGEEGYDPAHKFDLIFNTITHNFNAIIKNDSTDLVLDKTTWGRGGCGPEEDSLMKK